MRENPSNQRLAYRRIVGNPWKVILATLVVVAGLGYFLQYVTPSISFKDLLGESWPGLNDYNYLQTEYTADDNLLVLIEAKKGDGFTQDILTGVHGLTADLWKTPHSIRVDSVTNFQHTEADGDELLVGDLVPDPGKLDASALQRIKSIAINDPIALHRVVNVQGNVLAVNVVFHFPMLAPDEKMVSHSFVQNRITTFREAYPQTRVYVGGLTALDATVMQLSMNETGLFLGLVILISVLLLFVLLRVILPVLACIPMLLFSVIAGMALSGMMGWKLTPFTTTVPMIILILGIADCVHLITVYIHRMRNGESQQQALVSSLDVNGKAIFITSITTAIGFMTLNFSGSTSIAALGNEAAFGVMFACLLSVTFLPALLALLPVKSTLQSGVGNRPTPTNDFYQQWTTFLYNNRYAVLIGSLVVVLLLGLNISKNTFDDRIPTYFAKTLPWRQANDFSEEQFGSAYNFTYSIQSGAAGAAADPKYLAKLEKFSTYLRSLPKVAYVKSITDTFKRLNKNMHGDDPAYYRLPTDRDTAAQYLLLYEMSLPYGLNLNDQINLDKSASKVYAAFQSMSVSEVLAMEEQIHHWLDSNFPDTRYLASGVQIMFAHLMARDTKGLTMGAIYGLLIISALLIVMLRSVRIGVLSVLPNLLPIAMAFGVWGLFVGQVGFGLAMVSGMSIGIIVDDAVHFLSKYLRARRENGMDARQAVVYTYQHVAPSIVFTTVVLIAGFLTMVMVSEFRVNTDMGKMTSIILAFALIFDLIALPVLLMIFDREVTDKQMAKQRIAVAGAAD